MNGTFSMDNSIYVKIAENNVGIHKIESNVGKVFPNPAISIVTIPIFLNNSQNVKVNVFDNSGKIVKSIDETLTLGNHYLMIQNNFKCGNYIFETLFDDGTRSVQHVMVTK